MDAHLNIAINGEIADKHFDSLRTALKDLLHLYTQLNERLSLEKELLISARAQEISESNLLKESLLREIQNTDRHRISIAKSYAISLGFNFEDFKLSDFVERLSPEKKKELLDLREKLIAQAEESNEKNKENAKLTEAALENVHGALGEIRDLVNGHSSGGKKVYGKKGELKTNKGSGSLVSTEA